MTLQKYSGFLEGFIDSRYIHIICHTKAAYDDIHILRENTMHKVIGIGGGTYIGGGTATIGRGTSC